jgi:hypothetical protein
MKLISLQLEKALEEQEKHPYNICLARKTLEDALAHQLIQLSNGLLAWLVLHGTKLSKKVWQHQYYTYENQVNQRFREEIKDDNLTLRDYMKSISADISTGKIGVITGAAFNEIKLKIYGGYIKLWDVSKINDQLSRLGSEYRLAFLGQEEMLYNEIISFLYDDDTCPYPVDMRFIFGKVGSVTTLPFCPLFHFKTELVSSPLLKPEAAGFTFNHDYIVIRQCVLDGLESSSEDKGFEADQAVHDPEHLSELRFLHSLGHESIHVISCSERQRYPYNLFNWREETKRDILRYLQHPKDVEDLHKTFKVNFENVLIQEDGLFSKLDIDMSSLFLGVNIMEFMNKNRLENILDEMLEEGIIICIDGKLKSAVFEEGRKWEV